MIFALVVSDSVGHARISRANSGCFSMIDAKVSAKTCILVFVSALLDVCLEELVAERSALT